MLKDAVDWHSAIAERFDSRYIHSPSFRERLEVWSQLIARYADKSGSTLDAGCGSGVLASVASRFSRTVFAFDGSPDMVQLSREKQAAIAELSNVTFSELRMEQLSELGDQRFDLILSSSVLEYLDDFWGTIEALAMRLSESGTFIFSVPNMASVFRKTERVAFQLTGRPGYMAFVKNQLSDHKIKSGISERGLTVVETVYYAPSPILSHIARPLGMRRGADNLVAYVCKRS